MRFMVTRLLLATFLILVLAYFHVLLDSTLKLIDLLLHQLALARLLILRLGLSLDGLLGRFQLTLVVLPAKQKRETTV